MKKSMFAAGVLVLMAVSAWAQATPNFAGTWKLDLAKSDFGPAPPPDSVVMVIEHKEPSLKITTTQKSQMGDTINERNVTTDGKENSNKLRTPAGEQDLKSTTKWSGKKLSTASMMEVQGMSIGMNDSWDLSEDGKVLTVVRDIKTPQGDFATKMVYDKQ